MPALDIHPASPEELEAAHRNVHDVWSRGLPLDEHVRRRLAAPIHQRARWYVGCVDGRVVTSLGAYRIEFHVNSRVVSGMAIGSVHTLGEFRGQGLAPRLLQWVEAHEQAGGVRISMLYSDIDPEFYARLGYRLCPSLEGWIDISSTGTQPRHDGPEAVGLQRIDPAEHLATLTALYADYHERLPLAVHRGDEYWRHLLQRRPHDEFHLFIDAEGAAEAYVRLAQVDDALRITDYALRSHDATLAQRLYREVIRLGEQRGVARVGGWLPDTPGSRAMFALRPRQRELTMLKSLDDAIELTEEAIAATHHFAEIDHV